jgi:ectoine hydroxylase-related dioxygenase (phytanoyl-CoA dioxygenase family)
MPEFTKPVIRQMVISEEELKSGKTSLDTIQAAVEDFQTNGFIVLQNAVPHTILDKLSVQMEADARIKLADPDLVFNQGNEKTNFSVSPPLSKDWLHEEVWANKHAMAVMENIIGPKPQLAFASSNIVLPSEGNSARQAVHCDSYGKTHDFPVCIEVFLYLDEVTTENGSTELWPGSHKGWDVDDQCDHGRGWIKESVFNKRAEISPPIQCTIPKGSICMRDMRIWHAGMPNNSTQLRLMLGFIYFPRWFHSPMRFTLPEDCRKLVASWNHADLTTAAEFVQGKVDHLDPKHYMLGGLNFTQNPEMGIKNIRSAIDRAQGREENSRILVTRRDYWTKPVDKKGKTMSSVKFFEDLTGASRKTKE